jgi:hypothetical protein
MGASKPPTLTSFPEHLQPRPDNALPTIRRLAERLILEQSFLQFVTPFERF